MINDVITRIPLKKLFVGLFVVACLIFIATHRLFIIETSSPTEISLSTDPAQESFSGRSKRHIKIVGSGNWFIHTREGKLSTGSVSNGKLFMIPTILRFDLKPQYVSSKLTSNGGKCVLYDSPSQNTTVTTTCTTDNQVVRIIRDNVRPQQFISSGNIVGTSPTERGFFYVLSSRGNSSGDTYYNMGTYDAINQSTKTLFGGALKNRPLIITSAETGYTKGVLLEKSYVPVEKIDNNLKGVTLTQPAPMSSESRMVIGRENKGFLYVYYGTSTDALEGETEIVPEKKQGLLKYRIDTGKKEQEAEIDPEYLFREITVSLNGVVGLIGEVYSSNDPVVCTYETKLDCATSWDLRDYPNSLSFRGNLITYVASGKLWGYDSKTRAHHLLYGNNAQEVVSVNKIGSLYYSSTKPSESPDQRVLYNFSLDPDSPMTKNVTLDDKLPLSIDSDKIFVDHYRDGIVVFNYTGATIELASLKSKLKAGGVDEQLFDSTPIAQVTPKVYKPSPILLPLTFEPGE